jgi:hypothetical protein
MDKFFRRHDSETQKPGSFPFAPHIFESALHWLTGLVHLTEEEQKEAGIYLDDMPVNTIQQETHDN